MAAYSDNPFEAAMQEEADASNNPPNPFEDDNNSSNTSAPATSSAGAGATNTGAGGASAASAAPAAALETTSPSAAANNAGSTTSVTNNSGYAAGQDSDCCMQCCACLGAIPPKIMLYGSFTIAQLLVIGGMAINQLDYCVFDDGDWEIWWGMFGRVDKVNGGSREFRTYGEICEKDDDYVECDLAPKGIFYFIFLVFNFFVCIFIIILSCVKTIRCCCGDCNIKIEYSPVLIGICAGLMIIALIIWDSEISSFEIDGTNEDCDLRFFGWTNILLVIAICMTLSSSLYGCACARQSLSHENVSN